MTSEQELQFFSHEALESAIVSAAKSLQLKQVPTELLQSSGRLDDVIELNSRMVELLRGPELKRFVEERETLPPPQPEDGLGLRLHADRKNQSGKMLFFRVTQSLDTGYWSLIGLVTAICLRSPTFVIPSAAILTNLMRNIVQLKPERDAHAISAYNAFIASRLKSVGVNSTANSTGYPTTSDIHLQTANAECQTTVNGLTRLRELKLLEIHRWGGRIDDLMDQRNEWKELI